MSEAILEIRHLSKTFGTHAVLKDVDFTVNKGDVTSIIGASGSGKSTLLRCVNLLETLTTGEILFHGDSVTGGKINQSAYRARVGMVFQSFNLFNNLTVLENCVIGQRKVNKAPKNEARDRALYYLNKVGMLPYINARPAQISGGQKQRVSIAGVMAMHPKCIILDEPTAMLDPNGRKDVIRAARALNDVENITIVLITHYMEETIYADRIFVMDQGKVAMEGTPKEIFSQVERLKELRLDVPQVTLLAHELQKRGLPLPNGILTTEELVEALKSVGLEQ
ncbi:MAG: ATP-binding cassette domain-containing protein [Lachnospiraceae bacterium]|nr:ATP-binding cassette domain-containing protein [Lachnospiraceae bacterium]